MNKNKIYSLKYLLIIISIFAFVYSFYSCTSFASCKAKMTKSPYSNITLAPIRCINSRTYKISFDSNKLILKNDVKKSYITLKNQKSTLRANFNSISDDGHKITYILNKKSIKKLNPGNGSMNGSYNVCFSFCRYRTAVMYTEKIIKKSVTGFILSSDGGPIQNASVSLKTKKNKRILTKTDKNGHYMLHVNEVTSGNLTVQKKGYIKQLLNNIKTSKDSALCENFVLKPDKNTPITAMFHVTDTNGINLSGCKIDIMYNNKSIGSLTTDNNGNAIINNTKASTDFSHFTNIEISDKNKEISYTDKKQTISGIPAKTCTLKKDINYIFSISSSKNDSEATYKRLQFKFSFNDIQTDNVCFNVKLSKAAPSSSSLSDMSINLDSDDIIQNTSYFSIELFSLVTSDILTEPVFKYNCYIPAELQGNSSLKLGQLIDSSNNTSIENSDKTFSLSDGTYYIRIKAYSSENISVGATSITPFKVIDGKFDKLTATIKSTCTKEMITYIDISYNTSNNYPADFKSDISFILCQNKDDLIIPVAPVYIDNCLFTCKKDTSFAIASLTLTDLSPDSDYIIYPYNSYSEFTIANKKAFFTSSNESVDQIECIPSGSINNAKIFSELYQHNLDLSTKLYTITTINNTLIRKAQNYPNSVLCIYNSDSEISSTSWINTSAASCLAAVNVPFGIFTNNDYLT